MHADKTDSSLYRLVSGGNVFVIEYQVTTYLCDDDIRGVRSLMSETISSHTVLLGLSAESLLVAGTLIGGGARRTCYASNEKYVSIRQFSRTELCSWFFATYIHIVRSHVYVRDISQMSRLCDCVSHLAYSVRSILS